MKKLVIILGAVLLLLITIFLIKLNLESPFFSQDTTRMDTSEIKKWYGETIPLTVNGKTLQASVADSVDENALGLSGTPFLPPGMSKLFIFDHSQSLFFWMKDMNYSIDIIWLDSDKKIVHFEKNISPETYPKSFTSEIPAQYAVELPANYSDVLGLKIADKFSW